MSQNPSSEEDGAVTIRCRPPFLGEPPPSGLSLPMLCWAAVLALPACDTSLGTDGLPCAISRTCHKPLMSCRLPGVRQKRQICPASPGQVWTCWLGSAGLGQTDSQGSEGCPRELFLSWDRGSSGQVDWGSPAPPASWVESMWEAVLRK